MSDDLSRLTPDPGSGEVTLLGDVETTAERVRKASTKLEAERHELHESMRRAYREGVPVFRIARAAGMSRQRVSALVRR